MKLRLSSTRVMALSCLAFSVQDFYTYTVAQGRYIDAAGGVCLAYALAFQPRPRGKFFTATLKELAQAYREQGIRPCLSARWIGRLGMVLITVATWMHITHP
ncbi:hypothetical protein [Oleiagrimonas sp. C23AA]|uniref:hypothetical protein n=1 Tax=Oleiagrimonas sp. C23AA TaxID=2719047 RepID=UPI0014229328|nr:hypothetical protein [Oleiagrimonas sp. C23AA]NII10037.1 hypothetical protein [Oleiagrimonas sp. C23AA]